MKTKVRALTGTLAEVQARYAELENKIERFEFVTLPNGLVTLVYVAIVEGAVKVENIVNKLNQLDKQYHYDYIQGKKYKKIVYYPIFQGKILDNQASVRWFYDQMEDKIYRANSWKQKGRFLGSGKDLLTYLTK